MTIHYRYQPRAIRVALLVSVATLAAGAYALLSDARHFLGLESRPLVIGLGVLFVVVGVLELARWVWRLSKNRPALTINSEGCVLNLKGPPARSVKWEEIRSVETRGHTVIVTTDDGQTTFSTRNIVERPGHEVSVAFAERAPQTPKG